MRREPTIIDAINDPQLFAPWFKDRETWLAWFVFLKALFALSMSAQELALYQRCTGRTTAPTTPASEGWLIVGRRGGKSFIVALIAVFLACFRDYSRHLAPGERATIMVVATDRKQARVIFRYVRAYSGPILPLIPEQSCHPFRRNPATDSGHHSCHPGRRVRSKRIDAV